MAALRVAQEHLRNLAALLDQAVGEAKTATEATSGIPAALHWTHGALSSAANDAVTKAESERRAVGEAVQNFCVDLAEALRAAAKTYESAQEEWRRRLNNARF